MTKRRAWRFLLVTSVVNTVLAVVMNDLILRKHARLDVFVVTQFIGLSLWSAVAIALRDSLPEACFGRVR